MTRLYVALSLLAVSLGSASPVFAECSVYVGFEDDPIAFASNGNEAGQ